MVDAVELINNLRLRIKGLHLLSKNEGNRLKVSEYTLHLHHSHRSSETQGIQNPFSLK